MTLDEQLRQAFDTLAARLRDDVAGHAQQVVDGLISTAEAERVEAVAQAARDAWAEAERQGAGRYEAGLADAHAQARSDFKKESSATSDRLISAIRAIDQARSLSEILDALVTGVSAEVPRAGLFLSESGRLRSWRCAGFDPMLDESGALTLSRDDAGIVGDAAATGHVEDTGGSSTMSAPPAFAGLPEGRRSVAVPMQMSGQVFAVMYADHGAADDDGQRSWPVSVEVLARYAARCLEVVTATRLARADVSA